MPYEDIYLYSPLSNKTVTQGHNRALLLQFILSELFCALHAKNLEFVFSSPACFFPYDWCYEVGCLNKVTEHARLLSTAFPELATEIDPFHTALDEIIQKKEKELLSDLSLLFILLEPFIISCHQSESLLLYLLKHKDEIDVLAQPQCLTHLLKKMDPNGLEAISQLMQREFKARGFHALIPEIERLISHHEH